MAAILPGAWGAIDAYFRDNPYFLTSHQLDSYDVFLERGIPDAIRSMNPIKTIKTENDVQYEISMYVGTREIYTDRPTIVDPDGKARPLFPNEARTKDITYGLNVYADVRVEYKKDNKPIGEVDLGQPVLIGRVPLMLHSRACLLRGLPPAALTDIGECEYDRGGYFVIEGLERVIIGRENIVGNRLYVRAANPSDKELSHLGYVRVFAAADDVFPRTTTFKVRAGSAKTAARAIRVTVTHVGTKETQLPLFAIFRALGVESDRSIVEHVVYDTDAPGEADVVEFLRASALEAAQKGIVDQRSALAFLAPMTRFGTESDVKSILMHDLFPNMGVDFAQKALLLGHFVRRIVRVVLGKEKTQDRDDYSNIRVKLAGVLLSELFRNVYLRTRENCRRGLDREFYSGAWRTRDDIRTLVSRTNIRSLISPTIVTELMLSAMRYRWGVNDEASADDMEDGVVQELSRTSYLTYVSHVRRVNNPVDRSKKIADPHKMRASQWGAVCPVESPDGPNIGLIKHLAVLCQVTRGSATADGQRVVAGLLESGMIRDLSSYVGRTRAMRGEVKCFLNDTWVAMAPDPVKVVEYVRSLRRLGFLDRELSVSWSLEKRELHIFTDSGRCSRPLVIVDPETRAPMLPDALPGGATWDSLFRSPGSSGGGELPKAADLALPKARLEMVDVEEAMTLLVAMSPEYLQRYPANRYTHCELHPASILSMCAATYPLLNHNNAAYNVLCLAQFKQAVGIYATNFRKRTDSVGYVLHYPQRPLVSTGFADKLCNGELAHGENLVVAIASYTGYNQEDSILLNLDSVERGRLNLTAFKTLRVDEALDGGGGDAVVSFGNTAQLAAEGRDVRGMRAANYDKLKADGLPAIDSVLESNDIVVGRYAVSKAMDSDDTQYRDVSVRAGRSMSGVVDKALTFAAPGTPRRCKVRVRQMRQPELGDKLGSRFGQKGVVGMLLRSQDMPFCHSSGLVPDVIINPNAFPKRMTVTHLLECILGKAGAAGGRRYNTTTFERVDVLKTAVDELQDAGLHHLGDETIYNGKTGEQVDAKVFVGMNYYGRFKHMVYDKYQFRTRGPVSIIARQPTKGGDTGEGGGLRLGEMERDVLLAHGITSFLKESFMDRSDRSRLLVNAETGQAYDVGNEDADDVNVEVPFAFKTLQHELNAMGLDTMVEVDDSDLDEEDRGDDDGIEEDDDDGDTAEPADEDQENFDEEDA